MSTGSICVTVVDADNNHPIEGARVSLGGLDNQTPDPALTDSDGYVAFSINFGQSVAVTVTAEKDEYDSASREKTIQHKDTWELTLSLTRKVTTPTVNEWPTASAITYGESLSDSNLIGGSASVQGEFSFDSPSSLALTDNYDLTFVGADFTITKRPITVTAIGQTKVYGEEDPALAYQITSRSLAFNDAFTGALSREEGEDVGEYAIQQGTLALSVSVKPCTPRAPSTSEG